MGNLQHLTLLFHCNFGPDLAALLNRPVYMFTSFISKMLTGCANMYKVLASPVVSNCARSSNNFAQCLSATWLYLTSLLVGHLMS